jgi:hypothetical protein
VLVIVVAVGGVAVAVVLVVNVAAVSDGLMPAVWTVRVPVARVSQVRQGMFVVVAPMLGVRMALMNVIDMALALHARVAAAGAVVVVVIGMNIMPGGCHGSSLL